MGLMENKENGITVLTVNGNLDADGTQAMEERSWDCSQRGTSLLFDFPTLIISTVPACACSYSLTSASKKPQAK